MRDYYEILGVARDADDDSIKKAYRKLAMKYHPDRNGGDKDAEDKFKEATEAYEVLRDPDKRAAYNRYGHAGVKAGAGGQAGFSGFGFDDALNIFMRDFGGFGGFDDLFGRRRGRGGVQRGQDMRLKLNLSLKDVATGAKKTLKVATLDPCDPCEGTGSSDGSLTTCETCGGVGEVRRVQRSVFGQFVSASVCPTCQGEGQRIESPCTRCHGEGRQRSERTIEVEIPAGVTSENYLTLRGQGNAGPRGGPRGDILVVLEVEDDPRFLRDGDDLVCDARVSFSTAALGGEVEVPMVDGSETVTLKVAAGTQSGDIVTLRSKGLPHLGQPGRGDLHVRLRVWTPVKLSPEQESLLRRLQELEGEPPAESDKPKQSFWERVKEAFIA